MPGRGPQDAYREDREWENGIESHLSLNALHPASRIAQVRLAHNTVRVNTDVPLSGGGTPAVRKGTSGDEPATTERHGSLEVVQSFELRSWVQQY